MKNYKNPRIAAIQAAPILFDIEESLEKAATLTKEAANMGADIVVFPESYLPAYPRGMNFGAIIGSRTESGRKDFTRYVENSVIVPSKETEFLGKIAKENDVYLIMGITERDNEWSDTTLYCTVLFFAPDGTLLGKHRKLKPTASERLIWGEGDGSTMPVFDTPFGKIGALICWENYMPLARANMYAKGVHIYLAPTADARESWQSTLRHIAMEGRCFVIGVNQYVTKSMYPDNLACYSELDTAPEEMSKGGSAIVHPLGEYIVEPCWGKEEILLTELDLDQITNAKFDFDPVGHYARNDVFQLQVNEKKQKVRGEL
ncbi:carbon-nitrogen hydrolase family protein [Oceanobacillus halophilus]|uniref:Carbon-nitrogen hydrolase family protein n=1 Tax=Oceanobacillus halophilus TaxID=930130 RepID=A0A494ZZ20_9BACI|nr:carbon-nitrogen hydrolase family protein [Oceanobacillus halophilus]RKQ31392.1 carbon-nitrogen hydrolase family protein [Oceanobacillus halophilus]